MSGDKTNGKYKKLIFNTLILGLGVFGSKLLVFFMMPLYTGILSPGEYSTSDLISQTANLLMPLACVGISDGIFRFTMDSEKNRKSVLSSGVAVLLISGAVFALISPLLSIIDYFSDYAWLIALYVISANIHSAFAQYIRACNKTVLFSVQGIINTGLVIILNVIFLVVFDMGIIGYVLSVVISDFIVSVFLFIYGKLYKEISIKQVRANLIKKMLKYSIPMIPATIFWWITSVSDRYMVTYFLGDNVNGLYSAAYKIPTILTLLSSVFIEAWQYSAVSETNSDALNKSNSSVTFFSKVFSHYQSIVSIVASGIIALSQVFIIVLCADSYYEAWKFVPILTVSAVFSSFTSFMGSVYLVKKKSILTLVTSMSGALVNIILNLLLIPRIGAQGAAIATVASYLLVFVIRAINARKYVKFSISPIRLSINIMLIFAQTAVILLVEKNMAVFQVTFVLLMIAFNAKPFISGTMDLIKKRRKS